jgi:hypothetical protein
MAAALATTDSNPTTQLNSGESQIFSLIWLDTAKNDLFLCQDVRKNLRFTIDCIETFEQSDQCENYIRQSTEKSLHIVIVGEELGHAFIPLIHHFSHVFSIYIYENSIQSEKYTPLTNKYPKVEI